MRFILERFILELSKENKNLSRFEAESLTKKGELDENLLLIDSKSKLKSNLDNFSVLEKRLALTKRAYSVLFDCSHKSLFGKIKEFSWNKVYDKNFKVDVHDFNFKTKTKSKELADLIWDKLEKPKTNFKNPKTNIHFLFTKKKVYATLLLFEVNKSFLERKPHLKPSTHPTSLNPRLARAMINLLGIKEVRKVKKIEEIKEIKEKKEQLGNTLELIYDPFCGSGGILIEAGFMGFKTIGYDISDFMLKKAEKNFKHYKLKNFELKNQDATKIKHKMPYIVTDLPYGKNSKKTNNLDILYLDFLKNVKGLKRAVIGFPDFIDYKKIIKKADKRVINEFSIYLHKSLTKKIVVIENIE